MQQEAGGGLGCPPNPDSPPPQICVSPHPSDMTTLTAAAYQQGLAVHAGTHILNMQGEEPGGGGEDRHPTGGPGGHGGVGAALGHYGVPQAVSGGCGAAVGQLVPSLAGSPGGHSRAGTLMAADRAKQMFGPPVITVSGAAAGRGGCRGAGGRWGGRLLNVWRAPQLAGRSFNLWGAPLMPAPAPRKPTDRPRLRGCPRHVGLPLNLRGAL